MHIENLSVESNRILDLPKRENKTRKTVQLIGFF